MSSWCPMVYRYIYLQNISTYNSCTLVLIYQPNISFNISAVHREQGIVGRYNWRGSPYHMIIHALQTVLHLHNKYLSDDKYHVHVFRTGYCIHWTMKKVGWITPNKHIFLECKNIGNTNVFFYSTKNRFFKIWYSKKQHLKN